MLTPEDQADLAAALDALTVPARFAFLMHDQPDKIAALAADPSTAGPVADMLEDGVARAAGLLEMLMVCRAGADRSYRGALNGSKTRQADFSD
jgi:hypothetical protein